MGKLRRLSPTPWPSVDRPETRALQTPTFADLLKRHRVAVGVTQEELAERATLSVRAISYLEQGVYTRPQRETVRLLAEALDLPAHERVAFEAVARARRSPRGGPEPVARTLVNLPAQTTQLLGREDVIAAASTLLRHGDLRLLTVTGAGGVGKTRVAIAVAATVADDFPDGVCFVPLAPIDDPALVAPMIAQALEIKEQPGQALTGTLLAQIKQRRLLLVLDNFEQVAPARSLVAALLAACPRLKVLVTSREALRVRGEHEWPVQPLTLPARDGRTDPTVVMRSSAIQLFVQRATAVRPDFRVTATNSAAVASICVRLDGLPLAIELAAAHIKVLLPDTLLARLERRLPLLRDGASELPARQRTMRGAIDWSYDLLGADEQRLFRWLAIFAGGCSLEAAEAIGSALSDGAIDVFTGLALLAGKSLIRAETRANAERFTMLETVREYGLERLETSGETAAVQRAHATYFLSLVEAVEPRLTGAGQAAALAQLEGEHDNLRAVLRWTREHHETETGLRLAGMLWRFWQGHGHLDEGREWLEALLAPAEHGDHDAPPSVRATALSGAAMLAFRQDDYGRAATLSDESLALYQALSDRAGIADALNVRGLVAQNLGDAPLAASLYAESLALHRELGREWAIATSLNNLGFLARAQGDYARASAFLEESLNLYRNLGDTWGTATALTNLGRIAQDQGDYASAATLHEESLLLRKTLGDRRGIAIALADLGHIAGVHGNSLRATRLLEESLTLSRALGDRRTTARALNDLGDVARQQGDAAQAMTLYAESLAMNRTVGHLLGIAESEERLAGIAFDRVQLERAVSLLSAANALRAAIPAPLPRADRVVHDRVVAIARAALGEPAFAAAWAAGKSMSLEQTIAGATENTVPS